MKAIGKIGVIIPAITNPLESDLLNAIYDQVRDRGYDMIVFTNASNSIDTLAESDYVHEEEKIYALSSLVKLDGILFAAGRFHSSRVIEEIIKLLQKSHVPCVVLEMKQAHFPYVYASQREDIFAMTEHLITVHGYEKIYCLTGPKDSYEAEERRIGFCQAMEHYNLDSKNCFYGDFWKNSAKVLADDIANKKVEMPEAIVCTNDSMAVALCDALKKHGIKVPEQIAVTGYDGNHEALSYDPVITTIVHKERELAWKAVSKLCEMIDPEHSACDPAPALQTHKRHSIQYGESCGCLPKRSTPQKKTVSHTERDNMQETYLNSNLMMKMAQAESLKDLSVIVDQLAYLIFGITQLDICLCGNWHNDLPYGITMENNSDYTQKMFLLLSKHCRYSKPDQFVFETKIIAPTLEQEHSPQFVILMPIHYVSLNFGYMVMYYENGSNYRVDTFLQYWRDSLANGLHTLSDKMNIAHMNNVIETYSVKDPLTGILNKKGFFKYATDFFTKAEQDKKSCLMLVFSWTRSATPPQNKIAAIDIVVANALSLLCTTDKFCARISEKVFAVLMLLNDRQKENELVNQFTVSLERMIQRLQGEPILPEIPDINCDYDIIASMQEAEALIRSASSGTLHGNCAKDHITDYSVQLKRIRKELYLSPQREWISEELAGQLGISNGHFRKLYKDLFHVPFKEDHINARICKAKTLLSDTNLTIAEIAAQCGFHNASHFMRTFKAKSGKTAVQFRKEMDPAW